MQKRNFQIRVVSWVLCLVFIITAFGNTVSADAASSKKSLPKKNTTIRLMVDGKVYKGLSAKKVESERDWYLKSDVIRDTLGIEPVSVVNGYAGLRKCCKKQDISYEFDDVLSAAYIWTDIPYSEECDDELVRAYQLGFATKKQLHSLDKKITVKAYREMLLKMIDRTGKSGARVFFVANVKTDKKNILRGESFVMTYYAALAIGADTFANNNDSEMQTVQEEVCNKADFWNEKGCRLEKLFPNVRKTGKTYPEIGIKDKWDIKTLGYYWALCQASYKTGNHIFNWNKKLSMRPNKALTTKEAIYAVVRLYDSIPAGDGFDEMIPVDSAAATTMDGSLLTKEIKKKIKDLPQINSENVPQWTGPVLQNSWFAYDTKMMYSDIDVHNFANWGFNSFRYNIAYESLFNEDVTQANLSNLKKLDELVVAAIRYGMHFDIKIMTLPGRTATYDIDYNTTASLDLYINEDRQKEAQHVLTVLAKRYKNIPNSVLTFSPFWEGIDGGDMSTGIEAPEYSETDVYNTFSKLIKAIRKQDPNRLIVCEMGGDNTRERVEKYVKLFTDFYLSEWDNIIFEANYCQCPYVYAEMTDTEGTSIDLHNHSMFKPEYPTVIYAAQKRINYGDIFSVSGCLPAGTEIEIYLDKAKGSGKFLITADGTTLYSEHIADTTYKTGEHLSGYYPFAESDKKITLSLSDSANELILSYSGEYLEWSGINVILPKKYAVKKWYYECYYDASLDGRSGDEIHAPELIATSTVMLCPNSLDTGRKIVILDSVGYTSESIYEEANARIAEEWVDMLKKYVSKAQIRFEGPGFSVGTSQKSAEMYFSDNLRAMNRMGFGWYITGFFESLVVQKYKKDILAGGRAIKYKSYRNFNPELLLKLQECQF